MSYEEFIQGIILDRGKHGCNGKYHESHHIVPKCLGGKDDEANLIDLFPKEHYEAHRLLALENPHNSKLQFAWWCMSSMRNKNEVGRYVLTPEEFEKARIAHAESMSGKNNPMYGSHRFGSANPMYGHKHSERTRKLISDYNKAHPQDWTNNPCIGKSLKGKKSPNYGLKRTNEQKKKISDARKVYRAISRYDLNGNYIDSYDSEWEASEALNISVPCIRYSLKKWGNSAKGFLFIEKEEENRMFIEVPSKKKRTGLRAVSQYDLQGKYLQSFDSIKEAYDATGADQSAIIRCCQGRNKTAGGYKWSYVKRGDAR